MKIKFMKEYKFLRGFENDVKFTTTRIFKDAIIDTVEDEVPDEDVQWLIDNGFAEEVKESGTWEPKKGDRYYFVDGSGYIKHDTWDNTFWEVDRYRIGNVFRTEEAAKRYSDYLEAVATVRQDEGVLTPEQINERIKNEDLAYYVGYMGNRSNGEVLCGCTMSFDDCWPPVGVILFDSEVHADRSLDKHPDEWKIIVNYDWSRE